MQMWNLKKNSQLSSVCCIWALTCKLFSHNTALIPSLLWWTVTEPWFSSTHTHCLTVCVWLYTNTLLSQCHHGNICLQHLSTPSLQDEVKNGTHTCMLSSFSPLLWSVICVDPKHQFVDQSRGKSTIISVHSNLVYHSSSWLRSTQNKQNKMRTTKTKMSE